MVDLKIVPIKFDTWFEFNSINHVFYRKFNYSLALRLPESIQSELRERLHSSECPCCGFAITKVVRQLEFEALLNPELKPLLDGVVYYACSSCGFWKYQYVNGMTGYCELALPFAKKFNPNEEVASLMTLISVIKDNPALLYNTDPKKFELLVGSVLQEFYDCEVKHVGRSGDDGVDLIAIEKEEPILIQVKRRQSPNSVEGIDVVKLLFASAFARGADRGMVVTTAQRFSRIAKRWIHQPRLKDISFEMRLADINTLLSMIHAIRPADYPEPWQLHETRFSSSKTAIAFSNWKHYKLVDGDLVRVLDGDKYQYYIFPLSLPGICYELLYVELDELDDSQSSVADYLQTANNLGGGYVVEFSSFLDIISKMPNELLAELAHRWTQVDPTLIKKPEYYC